MTLLETIEAKYRIHIQLHRCHGLQRLQRIAWLNAYRDAKGE